MACGITVPAVPLLFSAAHIHAAISTSLVKRRVAISNTLHVLMHIHLFTQFIKLYDMIRCRAALDSFDQQLCHRALNHVTIHIPLDC